MRRSLALACAAALLVSGVASAQGLAPPPPMQPPPPQQQPPPPSTLAPPPPINPGAPGAPNAGPPVASPTVQQLDQAEKQDSGRGLEFFYAHAGGGFAYTDLASISNSTFGLQRTSQAGPMLAAGLGLRLLVLTLGAQFRYSLLNAYNFGQLEGVVGLHVPAGSWDPYLAIHGGYDFAGSLGDGVAAVAKQDTPSSVSVSGGNVGLQFGIDYYFVKFLSVGVDGAFDFLFLKRPQLTVPGGSTVAALCNANPDCQALYSNSGNAVGFGLSASLHVAIHL